MGAEPLAYGIALVLAVFALVESRGRAVLAWAVALIALVLFLGPEL